MKHLTTDSAMFYILMLAAVAVAEPRCPLPGNWELDASTSDEFEVDELDHGKWWDYLPNFPGRMTYFNHGRNVKVKDGCLELWTVCETDPEKMPYGWLEEGRQPFSTSAVKSRAKVYGGYYECRMKMNTAPVRGAFWLYDPLSDRLDRKYAPGEYSEEIDICEVEGRHQGDDAGKPYLVNNCTHHYVTPYYEGVCNKVNVPYGNATYFDEDLSQDFHTYGLYWGKEELVWYFDGKETYRIKHTNSSYGGFYRPLHVVLDSEVVDWGLSRCAKPAIDKSLLPCVEKIDWVRHWVEKEPEPVKAVRPEKCHLDHLEDGIMAIVHYGLNSFCDKEWGYGDTPPELFNPTALDANQWVAAMKDAGVRRVVLVTKHHDGFNLWPSKFNKDYTVANSPWRGGKGDLVKEVRDACLAAGLRFGTYLSPWDRHQASYATTAYTDYYLRQFDELFDSYGPISEIWLDGANGGDGWYGGACEKRKLDVPAWDYYRMPEVIRKMFERYPDAIAFGGHDVHSAVWVGNEDGFAPESVWYETARGHWETPECDTPLRRGWFWAARDEPKTLAHLVEIYFASVGRGCVLNLGIAPNREGLVGDDDAKRLKEFGDYVRAFNAVDLAEDAKRTVADRIHSLKLDAPRRVSCFDISEEIAGGQFVSAWKAEARVDGEWRTVAEGSTIGYRRLARFEAVESDEFRVRVTDAIGPAKIKSVALRWAESVKGSAKAGGCTPIRGKGQYFTLDESVPESEIVFRFAKPVRVSGFHFDPGNNKKVLVDRYAAFTSVDGKKWTKIVEDEFGNIAANPIKRYVWFEKPLATPFLKVVALRTADGTPPKWNREDQNCVTLY